MPGLDAGGGCTGRKGRRAAGLRRTSADGHQGLPRERTVDLELRPGGGWSDRGTQQLGEVDPAADAGLGARPPCHCPQPGELQRLISAGTRSGRIEARVVHDPSADLFTAPGQLSQGPLTLGLEWSRSEGEEGGVRRSRACARWIPVPVTTDGVARGRRAESLRGWFCVGYRRPSSDRHLRFAPFAPDGATRFISCITFHHVQHRSGV